MTRLLRAALPYGVFLAAAMLSWNRWIEPYVDSGRELMVPLRLVQGERLYRDVRFYYGPLAPAVAAATERALPRSLPARIALAALVALAHLEALRRAAVRSLSPGRAALCASLAVAVAFFLRPGGCHLFPYSLSTAIAVAGATWSLLLASDPARRHVIALGLCLFATLGSRPEIGIAAAVLVLLGAVTEGVPGRRRAAIWAVAGSLSGAALLYALVSVGTPLATLRQEGWLAFLSVPPEFRNVYRAFSGLDRPALRLAELALAGILLMLAGAWLAVLAFAARQLGQAVASAAAALSLASVALARLAPPAALEESLSLLPPLVRPLPLFLIAGALWRVVARVRRREDSGIFAGVPDGLLFLSALFAGRLLLAAGYIGPYDGFFLPLPVVVGAVGLYGLADRISRRPELSAFSRLLTIALVVFLAARIVWIARVYRAPAWTRVETPAGSLWIPEPVASATRGALTEISARTSPGGTLVGFPEAGFLQYVMGLQSPLPEDQFFPGHLDAAAEEAAIRRLKSQPPEIVVYVNVVTVGHGALAFGRDYLGRLDAAARAGSTPVAAFGPGAREGAAIGDPDFFIEVRVAAPQTTR